MTKVLLGLPKIRSPTTPMPWRWPSATSTCRWPGCSGRDRFAARHGGGCGGRPGDRRDRRCGLLGASAGDAARRAVAQRRQRGLRAHLPARARRRAAALRLRVVARARVLPHADRRQRGRPQGGLPSSPPIPSSSSRRP
jgi:hypothetical protein